jgi:hypothetical protein
MTLAIQAYLRAGGTPERLLVDLGVGAKRHPAYPNLLLFKYNQLLSPFEKQIVRECRGLILDEEEDWSVVARGFDKFFNYGEPGAASIDWSAARVQEKLDGSLCTLYHYDGAWRVATTGTPDAGGDINGSGVVFSDYFWNTLGPDRGELCCSKSSLCFLFELMGPLNRVVVVHERPRVVLLGARVRTTGEFLSADHARIYIGADVAVEIVREFPLSSFADIARSFDTMSPLSQEGYVVVDGQWNRVKVKHPGYVALHHAREGMSQRAIVDIARRGEETEVFAAFPELRSLLEDARSRLFSLCETTSVEYEPLRSIETQKDFALRAVKTRCPAALFAVRSGRVNSFVEYFASVPIDRLIDMLGYRSAP